MRRRRKVLFPQLCPLIWTGESLTKKERGGGRGDHCQKRVCEVCERDRRMPLVNNRKRPVTLHIPFLRHGMRAQRGGKTPWWGARSAPNAGISHAVPGRRVAHRRKSRVASRDHRVGHWRRASRGSTDIKITGHAAQEATRSCIVVQVQWLHLATRTWRTVCYESRGNAKVSPRAPLKFLSCIRRWTCRSAIHAPEAAVCLFWSASRKIDIAEDADTRHYKRSWVHMHNYREERGFSLRQKCLTYKYLAHHVL